MRRVLLRQVLRALRFPSMRLVGPALLLASRYTTSVMGPLVSLLVVRYLGPEQYGLYASATAVTTLFGVLSDFGLQQAALEMAASGTYSLSGVFRSMVRLGGLYTIAAYGMSTLWVVIGGYHRTTTILALCLGLGFFQAPLLSAVTASLQVTGRYGRIAVWNWASGTARWAATLAAIIGGANVYSVVLLPLVASWLVILVMLATERNAVLITERRGSQSVPLRALFPRSLRFGTAVAMSRIYRRSDSLLLSLMRDPMEIGYYAVAFRVVELINAFPGIVFNQVLYPKYFRWFAQDRARLAQYYHMTSKWMLASGVAAAALIVLFARDVTMLVVGSGEAVVTRFLVVMAWAIPARFVATSSGALLTTARQIDKRLKIQGTVALVNVGLNAALIPGYGGLASSMLVVTTDLVLVAWYGIAVWRTRGLRTTDSRRTALLGGVFVVTCLSIALGMMTHSLPLRVLSGVVVLGMALAYTLLTLSEGDRQELKGLIGASSG